MANIQELEQELEELKAKFAEFVHGDENTDVVNEAGTYPSFAKAGKVAFERAASENNTTVNTILQRLTALEAGGTVTQPAAPTVAISNESYSGYSITVTGQTGAMVAVYINNTLFGTGYSGETFVVTGVPQLTNYSVTATQTVDGIASNQSAALTANTIAVPKIGRTLGTVSEDSIELLTFTGLLEGATVNILINGQSYTTTNNGYTIAGLEPETAYTIGLSQTVNGQTSEIFTFNVTTSPAANANLERHITRMGYGGARFVFSDDYVVPEIATINVLFAGSEAGGSETFFSGKQFNEDTLIVDMNGGWIRFFCYSGTQLQGVDGTGGMIVATPSAAYFDGQIHWLQLVFNGSQLDLKIDGNLITSANIPRSYSEAIGVVGCRSTEDPKSYFRQYLAGFSIDTPQGRVVDLPLDEDYVSIYTATPSAAMVSQEGSSSTTVRLVNKPTDSSLYTLNTSASPDQWENSDQTVILPIAGTEDAATEFLVSVNMGGLETGATLKMEPFELDYMASKGIMHIRLPFKWYQMQPELYGDLDPTYLKSVKDVVDYAATIGMKVLLDVHAYGGRDGTKIGNDDGVLTVDHFADLWTKLATVFVGNDGVWGYDLNNEWSQMEHPEIVPVATQAAIDAIREIDTETTIFVEYYHWSSAWMANTYAFIPNDPSDNFVISAHTYMDRDSSGIHMSWEEEAAWGDELDWLANGQFEAGNSPSFSTKDGTNNTVSFDLTSGSITTSVPYDSANIPHVFINGSSSESLSVMSDDNGMTVVTCSDIAEGDNVDYRILPPLDTNVGAKRIARFNSFLKANGVQGHIGELGAGNDHPDWLAALDNAIEYCKQEGILFSYWAGGNVWSSSYGYSVEPTADGQDTKQMAVLTHHTGADQPTAFWTSVESFRGVAGQPIDVTVEYRGVIDTPISVNVIETSGNAGSFSETEITFASGFNGEAVVQFTPVEDAVYRFNTTNELGFTNNESKAVSTIQDAFAVTQEPETVVDFYKENSSYDGPCVRLRRDSDGQEMDFGFDESGWVDRAAIVAWLGSPTNVCRIVQMYGQTGNSGLYRYSGWHSTQPYGSSSDNRYLPILILESDEDGEPAILWRYNTRMDMKYNDKGVKEKTFFSTINPVNDEFFLTDDAGDYIIRLFNYGRAAFEFGGNEDHCGITVVPNELKSYAVSWQMQATGGMSTYVDGTLENTIDTTVGEMTAPFNTGKCSIGYFSFYNSYWGRKGIIKNIYSWAKALTAEEIAAVQSKLDSRPSIPPMPEYVEEITVGATTGPALPDYPLRGVGISGAEGSSGDRFFGFPMYNYVTQHDLNIIDYMYNSGLRVVRYAFDWNKMQPRINQPLNTFEFANMDRVVQHCRGLGMMVIIDPHSFNQHYYDDYRENGRLGVDVNLPGSVLADLWTRIATAYQNQDNVIFNIMNEPYGQSALSWRDVALEAIAAIRSITSTHMIQIPGTNYTAAHSWVGNGTYDAPQEGSNADVWNDAFDNGFTDPNYTFEMHQYLDSDTSGTHDTCALGAGGTRLAKATDWARLHGHKLFLGEFGWAADTSCDQEAHDILSFMENNSDVWNGWCYWSSVQWGTQTSYALNPVDISNPVDKPQMTIIKQYL